MRVERVDVRVDLIQVKDIRVLLVRDDLEPMGAGLIREGVTSGPPGGLDEVVTMIRLDGEGNKELVHAALSSRSTQLVQEGVLTREDDGVGGIEYRLTDKGVALWPVVHALMNWGEAFYSPNGMKRVLRHDLDGGLLDRDGHCQDCGSAVPVPEIRIEPGPGFHSAGPEGDPVSNAINTPRRLLEPIVTARTPS